MTTNHKLRPGTRVHHARHGVGRVLSEWGSFWACRHCFRELAREGEECECGHGDGNLLRVAGADGVYDVRFKGGVESINRAWLKLHP